MTLVCGPAAGHEVDVVDFAEPYRDELLRMWRQSFEHGVGIIDPHPLAEQSAYFDAIVRPTYRVRLALRSGAVVGMLASNSVSVAQLHVRVCDHGQGIGTRLLRLAQDDCAGRLWLYTFVRNARACRFYEHHGFCAVARGFEPDWQLEDVRYEWTRPPHEDRAAHP
ncbi:MAG: GNAT family N-acetyltransferase [Rubrivivax sp.]